MTLRRSARRSKTAHSISFDKLRVPSIASVLPAADRLGARSLLLAPLGNANSPRWMHYAATRSRPPRKPSRGFPAAAVG